MKLTFKRIILGCVAAVMIGGTTAYLHAQVEPVRQGVETILGTGTGGSCGGTAAQQAKTTQADCTAAGGTWTANPTGIYELVAFVAIGLAVILGVILTVKGFSMMVVWIRAVRAK